MKLSEMTEEQLHETYFQMLPMLPAGKVAFEVWKEYMLEMERVFDEFWHWPRSTTLKQR